MGTITAEHNLFTCAGCGERLPFDRFHDGGRIDSDTGDWFCGGCNRCPDCGLGRADGVDPGHRCRFPRLAKAIGVKLSATERREVVWLASCDPETADAFSELFRRVRKKSGGLT